MSDMYKSWECSELTEEQRKRYTVIEVGESFDTWRTTFSVTCNICNELIHPRTNNPSFYIEIHDRYHRLIEEI